MKSLRWFTEKVDAERVIARSCVGGARRDESVVVVHEPTSLFLAAGLELGHRDQAVTFDDAESAEGFLARHASEPCFAVIAA
jgi:hypothetical protein